MAAPPRDNRHQQFSIIAAAAIAGVAAFALMLGASPAAWGAKPSPERRPLGSVTAVAWSVHTPVGARLRLGPFVTVNVQKRALRLLRARKPRVSARFVARIVTRPRRGRARTLAVVSRRIRGQRIRASSRRRLLGRRLPLRRIVLTRRQTARVKRAAGRQRLAIVASVGWRARYTDAAGQTVITPSRSAATMLPVSLRRPRARGAKLRGLVLSLRRLMLRIQRARIACVTRDTIMSRLRITYGPLASGRRSDAADLLRGWTADIRSKAAAGVLPNPDASRLQSGLRSILARVGSGRSKPLRDAPRLPPPPHCGPSGARSAQVTIAAAMKVARNAFTLIYGGTPVRRLKKTLWPDGPSIQCAWDSKSNDDTCSDASIYDLIESDKVNFAGAALNGLSDSMELFFSAEDHADKNPAYAAAKYADAVNAFVTERESTFQATGYEKPLLPLFAEYENLYLSLLRHGVLDGPKFGLVEEDIRDIDDMIAAEVGGQTVASCPNDPCPPKAYITYWFQDAVHHDADHHDDNQKQYASKNPVWVDKQLKALDFRDMWPLQDPLAYPYGDPNFRQQRMIYSDEWGRTHDSSNFPEFGMDDTTGELTNPPMPNVEHPLSHLGAWLKSEYTKAYSPNGYYNWLSATKVDNAPVVGSTTGDGSLSPDANGTPPASFSYDVAPGASIPEVGATWSQKDPLFYPQNLIQVLQFNFNDGSAKIPGGHFYNTSHTRFWSYDDEVLATAKIVGSYKWSDNNYVGNAIVFGFRLEDSFAPASPPAFGKVTPPSPNDQKCLAVEQTTLEGNPYTYVHQGEQTGYRRVAIDKTRPVTDPGNWRAPQAQMYDCNYTRWNGTATWETTWSFNNQVSYPGKAPGVGQLTVFGGSQCAAPDPADKTLPIAVQAQECDETNGQQLWNQPRPDGTIVHTASARCLERSGLSNGDPLRLNNCNGSEGQKWNWPAGWNAPSATDMTPPAVSVAAAP